MASGRSAEIRSAQWRIRIYRVDRAGAELVGEIADLMDLDVLVPKIMPLKPIDMREIVRGASSETEEVVITAESFVESYTGEELADHYGAQKPSGAPDPTVPLSAAPQSR